MARKIITHAFAARSETATYCGIPLMMSGAGFYYRRRAGARSLRANDKEVFVISRPTCKHCRRKR